MEKQFPEACTEKDSRKTLLIADDQHVNRAMLARIFSPEYRVLEAENGVRAMELLRREPEISGMILDIIMPEMDGYAVLETMSRDERLSLIPVIVVTAIDNDEGQIRALNLGARDVIAKPFHPEIMKRRVANILSQTDAIRNAEQNRIYQAELAMKEEQLYLMQHDSLTGLYSRDAFTQRAKEIIKGKPADSYVLSCLDIDDFKVVNDRFGHGEGDRLLKFVADTRRAEVEKAGGIACRNMADSFFSLIPNDKEVLDRVTDHFMNQIQNYDLPMRIGVHVGRYIIDEPTADVNLMIDRALLAVRSIKGSADVKVAWFNEKMRRAVLRQQELIDDMRPALQKGQFVLYYQPQYNYATGKMTGAEALVRWDHPQKGLISPGEFIPLFEKNGFISTLDEYVWETACRQQRAWLDAGIGIVPVSVNISRRDIRNDDLPDMILRLVRKYDLEPKYINLEITESAYVDHPQMLIRAINRFEKAGFCVEMDDFGSGYSSLNTLKDVPVNILKLDMKFLGGSEAQNRGGCILSSVIRMAHWLKLPVIAEGVEDRHQAEYLKSIGCSLMQGYYFAKPMDAPSFEALLRSAQKSQRVFEVAGTDIGQAVDFLGASTQAALLFNSFVGGAYIAEYNGSNVEAIRINDRFFEILGCSREDFEAGSVSLLDRFYPESAKRYIRAMKEAIRTGKETECEMHSRPVKSGGDIWTMNRFRFLAQNVERYIFYVSVSDITKRKKLERKLSEESGKNAALIENFPGGAVTLAVTRSKVVCEYFSDGICRMLGYSRREMQSSFSRGLADLIVSQEEMPSLSVLSGLSDRKNEFRREFHLRCRDGSVLCVSLNGHPVPGDGGVTRYYCICTEVPSDDGEKTAGAAGARNRIWEEKRIEEAAYRLIAAHTDSFVYCYDIEADRVTMPSDIAACYHLEDTVSDAVQSAMQDPRVDPAFSRAFSDFYRAIRNGEDGRTVTLRYRIFDRDYHWFRGEYSLIRSDAGNAVAAAVVFTNIDDQIKKNDALSSLRGIENLLRIVARHSQKYLAVYDFATDTLNPYGDNVNVLPNILPLYSGPMEYLDSGMIAPESVKDVLACYKSLKAGHPENSVRFCAKGLDGGWKWLDCTLSTVTDSGEKPQYAIATFEDITDRYEKEIRLTKRAEIDPVTGIYNRVTFTDKVITALADAAPGEPWIFAVLDVDHFKAVNDSFGHTEGDRVLHDVALAMTALLPKGGFCGRLGGDEFGMLFPQNGEKETTAAICGMLRRIDAVRGEHMTTSASIGLSVCPDHGNSFAALYRAADTALYHAKENGRNRYAYYVPGMAGERELPDT